MGAMGPVRRVTASQPPASLPPAGQPASGWASGKAAVGGLVGVLSALRACYGARARREVLFCLTGLPFAIPIPVAGFYLTVMLLWLATPSRTPNPSWWGALAGALAAVLLVLLLVATGAARRLGGACRALASRLLGEPVTEPPPVRPRRGMPGWLAGGLRDGPGWRAVGYLMLKCPVALLELYALFCWGAGLVNLTYPFWWLSFRNHAPGVHLKPVPVFTPFGWSGQGTFHVATLSGTFAAFAAGAAMLLAAPWVTRAVVTVDRWLIRALLGPRTLAQRIRDLEQTRARAVDDSAALLRQVERNLHDGAQIRLATLAMNLGMAREKLGTGSGAGDIEAARELVDAAHRGAKDALAELRELAKGIHPPVLDNGLADALATLAASSAIPAQVISTIGRRPTPAIETIAYFCAAELLANAVKHSFASKIKIVVAERGGVLMLAVSDDGCGGADPDGGSGLAGLAQRVSTVDGRLDVTSPPGGPTRISIALPLRA